MHFFLFLVSIDFTYTQRKRRINESLETENFRNVFFAIFAFNSERIMQVLRIFLFSLSVNNRFMPLNVADGEKEERTQRHKEEKILPRNLDKSEIE